MATTTSITTTYEGEFKQQWISAALLSGNTIVNGGITVKPNIKFKEVVKKLSIGAMTSNATCDFTATSSVTITERIIEPEEFQVNLTLCKKLFRSDWDAISMGISVHDNLPKTFQDFIMATVVAKVAQENEINIWRGVTANDGQYDGLVTLATADSDVIDVVGTTITAGNVIAELGKVVDKIPNNIYGQEETRLYMAQNVMKFYVRALGGFGASGLGASGINNQGTQWFNNGSLSFDGVPLFMANGLPENFMYLAQKDNIWFGTGILNDMTTEAKVIDMAETDGSQNIRLILRYTAAVQHGIGSEIVLYTPV